MAWNLFNKPSVYKKKLVPAVELAEFEKHKDELLHLEKQCKKLMQEMKKCQEAIHALKAGEVRVPTTDQSSTWFDENPDDLSESDRTFAADQALATFRQACSDPLKSFTDTCTSLHAGLKRWDTSLQEYGKVAEKLEKSQKQKEPQVKVDQLQTSLLSLRREFETINHNLLTDMRLVNNTKYQALQPLFDAYIQLQMLDLEEERNLLSQKCQTPSVSTIPQDNTTYNQLIISKLNAIKNLSITVDN